MTVWRRYVLFQIPGWILAACALAALHHWLGLSLTAAVLIFAVYAAKDFALYPLMRRSYEQDPRSQLERLVGEPGVVTERLCPQGYVRVRGELWQAEVRPPDRVLENGSRVTVEGAQGWTLRVRAAGSGPAQGPERGSGPRR